MIEFDTLRMCDCIGFEIGGINMVLSCMPQKVLSTIVHTVKHPQTLEYMLLCMFPTHTHSHYVEEVKCAGLTRQRYR